MATSLDKHTVSAYAVMRDGVRVLPRSNAENRTGKDLDLLCSLVNGIVLCSKVLTGYPPTCIDFTSARLLIRMAMENPQIVVWVLMDNSIDPKRGQQILSDFMDRYLAREAEALVHST